MKPLGSAWVARYWADWSAWVEAVRIAYERSGTRAQRYPAHPDLDIPSPNLGTSLYIEVFLDSVPKEDTAVVRQCALELGQVPLTQATVDLIHRMVPYMVEYLLHVSSIPSTPRRMWVEHILRQNRVTLRRVDVLMYLTSRRGLPPLQLNTGRPR